MTSVREQLESTRGFTLAELLLAIAIIVVLVTIALPSIFSAQRNMHMVELDSAAKQIAEAAQTKMTSLKISGIWLSTLDESSIDLNNQRARNYPNVDANGDSFNTQNDIYYLTADQIKDLDILSENAIDTGVYEGDYLIEFSKSTASVCGVFYSDRKQGFFNQAEQGSLAKDFYQKIMVEADRLSNYHRENQRLTNTFLIGYFGGVPAGATNTVALKKPSIYVDEDGLLCVQNLNLYQNDGEESSVELVISHNPNQAGQKIIIAGLQQSDTTNSTYSIGISDSSLHSASNADDAEIYKLDIRDENLIESSTNQKNVFKIDLNHAAQALATWGSAESAVAASFEPGNDLYVSAKITLPGQPSVPAQADAYMKWPAKSALLTLLVTNPALDADVLGNVAIDHIKGTYTNPKAELVSSTGDTPITNIALKTQEKSFPITSTKQSLLEENPESGRQAYSGGYVRVAEAVNQQANVRATVGSYTTSNGVIHQYQIYEIWVNGSRAGYLEQNAWVWEGEFGELFKDCVIGLENGTITSSLSTITIDSKKLYDKIKSNKDEGYDVYIRTTPKTEEVQAYFTANKELLRNYLTWSGGTGTTGSRGENRATPIRKPFENEFGASSTVGLWNLTTTAGKSVTLASGNGFPSAHDLRVYYTATPAIAWGNEAYGSYSLYTALPSAVLWLYQVESSSKPLVARPAAYVQDDRSGDITKNFCLSKSSSADFEISYSRDNLFYRVIQYYDTDGKTKLNIPNQYVPHSVMNDAQYAMLPAADNKPQDKLFFSSWTTTDTYPSGNSSPLLKANETIGVYNNSLAYGSVKLQAHYLKASVGLMYLEFADASKQQLTGYSGYVGADSPITPIMPDGNQNASWGYYVVVPAGTVAPTVTGVNRASTATRVTLGGSAFDAYLLVPSADQKMQRSVTVPCSVAVGKDTLSATFYVNFNFAAAVETNKNVADAWGSREEVAWEVREATQFLGSLKWWSGSSGIQALYSQDCFIQTHDLDMRDAPATNGNTFNTTFSGIYDGNGFVMNHFSARIEGYVVGTAGKQGQGVFCSIEGAVLKGITLYEDAAVSKVATLPNSATVAFGCLVGSATDSIIADCEVEIPYESEEDYLYLSLKNVNAGSSAVGGLVGSAINTVIEECFVSGVGLSMTPNTSTWANRSNYYMGGMVGRFETWGTGIVSSSVEGVLLNSSIPTKFSGNAGYVCFGGLAGDYKINQAPGLSKIIDCSVEEIVFLAPQSQVSRASIRAGGLVGYAGGKNVLFDDSEYEDVFLRYGSREPEYIEDELGREILRGLFEISEAL